MPDFDALANPNCPDCLTRTRDTTPGDRVVCGDCGRAWTWQGQWVPAGSDSDQTTRD